MPDAPPKRSSYMVNRDVNMLEVMEASLVGLAQEAFTRHNLKSTIKGVFNLEDMEALMVNDLGNCLCIGIGYMGTFPVTSQAEQLNPSATQRAADVAKGLEIRFVIILAVPVGPNCMLRYDAGRILTALRFGILGRKDLDDYSRTWDFVVEKPEPAASDESVMYYSQVWRVVLPVSSDKPLN